MIKIFDFFNILLVFLRENKTYILLFFHAIILSYNPLEISSNVANLMFQMLSLFRWCSRVDLTIRKSVFSS